MKKLLLLFLCLALGLCACGQGALPAAQAPSPAAILSPSLPPSPSPAPTSEPTPEPSPALLRFPDGSLHSREEQTLDLSAAESGDVPALLELLGQMPLLQTVDLGCDRATAAEEGDERLSWTEIRSLEQAAPQAAFLYRFRFCGKDFSLQDEEMDLNHRPMEDEGAAVAEILPCMQRCRRLDMDSCGVSNQAMARIRDANPDVEVIWRIWFGVWDLLSVRTDVERILASKEDFHLEKGDISGLQYCTKVKYLDLGHMRYLQDWSFLGSMPELEVLIISLGDYEDLSFLSNCPHLEYLEMGCRSHPSFPLDLSFLGDLKELRHLNITRLGPVKGWEVLEGMTQLERLWIGGYTDIPQAELQKLQELLPDTEIELDPLAGIDGHWRYLDGVSVPNARYELLRQQMGYDKYDQVCAWYWNDPLYDPHD